MHFRRWSRDEVDVPRGSWQVHGMYVCIDVYLDIHTYMHAYIHTCIHAYTHTCIHAYMYVCIHTYIHTYTSIYTCIHICIAYVYAHVYAYMYTPWPRRAYLLYHEASACTC